MNFIKLTDGEDTYFVNTQEIRTIRQPRDNIATIIWFKGVDRYLEVDESPEEIMHMIKEGDTNAEKLTEQNQAPCIQGQTE